MRYKHGRLEVEDVTASDLNLQTQCVEGRQFIGEDARKYMKRVRDGWGARKAMREELSGRINVCREMLIRADLEVALEELEDIGRKAGGL